MSSSRIHRWALALVLGVAACEQGGTEPGGPPPPEGVRAVALARGIVRVSWKTDRSVNTYDLERRENFSGEFRVIKAGIVPSSSDTTVFIDETVQAEQNYGYRVVAVSLLDKRSAASAVWGARTPPLPGMQLQVTTVAEANYPTAVRFSVRDSASDSVRANVVLPPVGGVRLSPLPAGAYRVRVVNLPIWCASADSLRPSTVRDGSLQTIDTVRFVVVCRDSTKGRLVVRVQPTGSSVDTLYRVVLSGIAKVPGSTRDTAIVQAKALEGARTGTPGYVTFEPLFTGTYQVSLEDIAANCTVTGATANATVRSLSSDTIRFGPTCAKIGATSNRSILVRPVFNADSAAIGDTVQVALRLDLTRRPTQNFSGLQFQMRYDPTVLRFVKFSQGQLISGANPNGGPGSTPGLLLYLGADDGSNGQITGGTVDLGTARFVVTGAVGASFETDTKVTVFNSVGTAAVDTSLVGTVETTFRVKAAAAGGTGGGTTGGTGGGTTGGTGGGTTGGTGGGTTGGGTTGGTGGGAVSLTANANGPYAGTAGSALTVAATGSTAGATYTWDFGDGTSGTGFTLSKTYAAAGTYTVRLTVSSGTSTAQATSVAVISAAGGGTTGGAGGGTGSGSGGGGGTIGTGGGGLWRITNAFSAPDASGIVTLIVSVDLPRATPDTAMLGDWTIPELRWNPSVLEFVSLNFGAWSSQATFTGSDINQGILSLQATAGTPNNVGTVTLARVRFRVIGPTGSSTTTQTTVSRFKAAPALGSTNYLPRLSVLEGTFVTP